MNSVESTISKYLGATCEVNGRVFKIIELEYYPAVEPEGNIISTRESSEKFRVNDVFVADRNRKHWKFCLVNIVVKPKENIENEKVENLLIRGIQDGNGDLVARRDGQPGPGIVYKYLFGEDIVSQDNNGQIKIIDEPSGSIKIKTAQRKRDGKIAAEPFEYNFYIEDTE
jgi:hypothetical protein